MEATSNSDESSLNLSLDKTITSTPIPPVALATATAAAPTTTTTTTTTNTTTITPNISHQLQLQLLQQQLLLDSKAFKQLLDSQSLVDCTLACDGGKISAHKIVLSICSSYLNKILQEHPVEHPIIILPELNIEDVKTLVHYMYTGELLKTTTSNSTSSSNNPLLHQQSSGSLLKTAAFLSVNSLQDFLNSSTTTSPTTTPASQEIINLGQNQQTINMGSSNMFINGTGSGSNSKSEFQFRCPACLEFFHTICSFEYHMQKSHNVTSFGCEICHKPFASLRYVLTDHMRRCHGWRADQQRFQPER